jgi:hypothetical protein
VPSVPSCTVFRDIFLLENGNPNSKHLRNRMCIQMYFCLILRRPVINLFWMIYTVYICIYFFISGARHQSKA